MLRPVPREDIIIPPLKPDAKPGVGEPPVGYHVMPSGEVHKALINRNAWA
jgi:hypothetical protein